MCWAIRSIKINSFQANTCFEKCQTANYSIAHKTSCLIFDQYLSIVDLRVRTSPPYYKRYHDSLRLDSSHSSSLPLRHNDDHLTCFTETVGAGASRGKKGWRERRRRWEGEREKWQTITRPLSAWRLHLRHQSAALLTGWVQTRASVQPTRNTDSVLAPPSHPCLCHAQKQWSRSDSLSLKVYI